MRRTSPHVSSAGSRSLFTTPSASLSAFTRNYDDIDIVIEKRGRKHIDAGSIVDCGYEPDVEFNNLHGLNQRRTYYSDTQRGKLDVFIGEFSMCHELSFDRAAGGRPSSVPLADLLLTKAQIYELNRKDAYDLIALLADHEIASGDEDVEINADRIAQVCGSDWGFWRTVNHTIDTLEHHARRGRRARERAARASARRDRHPARPARARAQEREVEAAGQGRRPQDLVRPARGSGSPPSGGIEVDMGGRVRPFIGHGSVRL